MTDLLNKTYLRIIRDRPNYRTIIRVRKHCVTYQTRKHGEHHHTSPNQMLRWLKDAKEAPQPAKPEKPAKTKNV